MASSEFTIEALGDILELSAYFLMDGGRIFALTELEERALTPVQMLLMAQRHQITTWIPRAVRALVARPPNMYTLAEYQALGLHNIYLLDKTRSTIQYLRQSIAFLPPSIMHDERVCDQKEQCSNAWEMAWWGGFAKHYLHPDMPSNPDEAMAELHNAFMPGVCSECLSSTVAFVESKRVLYKEETYIMGAISELGG